MNADVNRTTISAALGKLDVPDNAGYALMFACWHVGFVPDRVEFNQGDLVAVSGQSHHRIYLVVVSIKQQRWVSHLFDDRDYMGDILARLMYAITKEPTNAPPSL